ncbi:MAG: hypothetical protein ACLFNT_06605 [Spirochaetales bacterium]
MKMTRFLLLLLLLILFVALSGCAFSGAGGLDGSDGGNGSGSDNSNEEEFDEVTKRDPAPFDYPDYSDSELASIPSDYQIGELYLTVAMDPADPNFAHREKPIQGFGSADQAAISRKFQVAWYYYKEQLGIDLGRAMPAGPDGVQADGLVHLWTFDVWVQNLVPSADTPADYRMGDPWDDGVELSALLVSDNTLDAPVYVVTQEMLLDWDKGPPITGHPLENPGNTEDGIQIFAQGLYEVIQPAARAQWKVWAD